MVSWQLGFTILQGVLIEYRLGSYGGEDSPLDISRVR